MISLKFSELMPCYLKFVPPCQFLKTYFQSEVIVLKQFKKKQFCPRLFSKTTLDGTLKFSAMIDIAFFWCQRKRLSLLPVVTKRKKRVFELFCLLIFFRDIFRVDSDPFNKSEYVICFKINLRIREILGIKVPKVNPNYWN